MSKFLVTGGHGLIGHNVVQRLQARDETVSVVDNHTTYGIIPQAEVDYLLSERLKKINDHTYYNQCITDGYEIDYIVEKEKPKVIIHCASFPRQKVVNANPAHGADVMMKGLINLLESAKKHGVERFVYISSSMVYGDFEDQVLEDDACAPQGQYGIMKLAGEWLVKDYARRCGFEYVIVRPSAVYGPLDVEDRVVAKFMLQAMRGATLRVNGASETLDFIRDTFHCRTATACTKTGCSRWKASQKPVAARCRPCSRLRRTLFALPFSRLNATVLCGF